MDIPGVDVLNHKHCLIHGYLNRSSSKTRGTESLAREYGESDKHEHPYPTKLNLFGCSWKPRDYRYRSDRDIPYIGPYLGRGEPCPNTDGLL